MVVCAYISGHGYGHYTRSQAVLAPLAELSIHVVTHERALRLARLDAWPASVREVDVGPGYVQRGPLAVDIAATRAALEAHLVRLPALVEEEAAWLRKVGAAAVFGD